MTGQLLRLSLIFMSLTCSSSVNPTIIETNNDEKLPVLTTNDPSFAALNANTTSDKVATLINASTRGLMVSHASTKEPNVNPGQKASPVSGTTPEETSTLAADVRTNSSTTGKDRPPAAFTSRPVSGLITRSTDLPLTGHEDNKTNDKMNPSSDPSGKTMGSPKTVSTQDPKMITMSTKQYGPDPPWKIITLIVVCIIILILILVTVLIIMVRSKRRRGSQSFSTRSRSSNRQDVWAGQVPELGDGKVTAHPVGMENGKVGNQAEPGTEQEMITFISGEKNDSMMELNEMGKGDALDEKKPLLEETSPVNEEPKKSPEEKNIPVPTVEQELL